MFKEKFIRVEKASPSGLRIDREGQKSNGRRNMYVTQNDCRCPQCRRLLFKTLQSDFWTADEFSCPQCEKGIDCRVCTHKNCYLLTRDINVKCPECKRKRDCTQCERYYYRAWVAEKEKSIEIKCPKCKKILTMQ